MSDQAADNPMSEAQRRRVIADNRGRPLGNGKYRNFCAKCCMPMEVHLCLRDEKTILCRDCDRVPSPGPVIAGTPAMKDDTEPGFENAVRAMEEA